MYYKLCLYILVYKLHTFLCIININALINVNIYLNNK